MSELPRTTAVGRHMLRRFAAEAVRIYRDPAKPGNGVSRPALDRLIRDGLINVGEHEPLKGRLLELTDLGRAVLEAAAPAPLPRGTWVRYHGSMQHIHGFDYVVLGPCGCDRHPCQDDGCDSPFQAHYELADPWEDRNAGPLTLRAAYSHVRHSSLTPISEEEACV